MPYTIEEPTDDVGVGDGGAEVPAARNSVKIDWTVREDIRAEMRVIIKRILRRYGYPPDMQARATDLVLEQAEVLCQDYAIA